MIPVLRQISNYSLHYKWKRQTRLFSTMKCAMKIESTVYKNRLMLTLTSRYFQNCKHQRPAVYGHSYLQTHLSFLSVRFQSNDALSNNSITETVAQVESKSTIFENIHQPSELTSHSSTIIDQSSDVLTNVDVTSVVQSIEPSFISQGLAGWSPPGIIQQCLEYIHVHLDVPWWLTIVIATIIVRTLMFPLVIKTQKNAAKLNRTLPQMQVLQLKITNARNSGNPFEVARWSNELALFMKEKDVNPLRSLVAPLVQAPIFISFYLALRGMSNLPVESLKTGGLFWFENLAIADPYYILPLITSCTLYLTIRFGVDGVQMENMQMMRYVLQAMPIVIFPFTIHFSAAILCYWMTTNAYSLVQVIFLRWEPIRKYLDIPPIVKHSKDSLPMQQKGFVEGMKDVYTNAKITRQLEERKHFDNVQFRKAGMGPIQKTYPYDPTKQTSVSMKEKST